MDTGRDVDEVLFPFVDRLRDWLAAAGVRAAAAMPAPARYDFAGEWGLGDIEWVEWCHQAADDGLFVTGPPLPGARAGWAALRAAGHRLHVVTARAFGSAPAAATETWLSAWGFDADSLHVTAAKHLVACDIFIDDSPAMIAQLTGHGHRAVIADRAWNRHLPASHERVEGVDGLARLLATPRRPPSGTSESSPPPACSPA
jgi:hypothetical protein